MRGIGIALIFISAFVSIMLRKDLGNTVSDLEESIEMSQDDEQNIKDEYESMETVAQDQLEIETDRESSMISEIQEEDIFSEEQIEKIILVNRNNPLPKDYEVELKWLPNGREQVATEMYDDLQAMLSAGKRKGLQFVVASGYRSISEQQGIWDDTIRMWVREGFTEEEAVEETSKTLAYPGESEHATGLAVDIVSIHYQHLDDKQHDTRESTWLRENCYKYGFILRYPEDKEDITGITYESWHFRYVGKAVASYIMEQELTLEEYLKLKIK